MTRPAPIAFALLALLAAVAIVAGMLAGMREAERLKLIDSTTGKVE